MCGRQKATTLMRATRLILYHPAILSKVSFKKHATYVWRMGSPPPTAWLGTGEGLPRAGPAVGGIWVDLQRNNEQEDTVLHFLLTV